MDAFNQSLDKLTTLLTLGHITAVEFERRRQTLLNSFVGAPGAVRRATPRPALGMRAALPAMGRPFVPRRPMIASPMMASPMMGSQFMGNPFGNMMMMGAGLGGGFGGFGGAMRGGLGGFRGGFGAMRGGFGMGGMRFSPFRRVGARARIGSTAVKIQPVPDGTQVEELKAMFEPYGEVVLAVLKEGSPRHAYISFNSAEEAAAAAASGSVVLMGQPCAVRLSRHKRPAIPEGAPTNGIGIFNIPLTLTQDELYSMLAAYPGFQSMKMVTNKMGEFRGYAFAYFDSVPNATVARASLRGFQIGENTLDCKYSNKSAEEALAAMA